MNFESFHITADVGSVSPFEIYPTFDFSEEIIINRKINRTIAGQHNNYQLNGDYFRYTIPLEFVNSETRANIVDWWRNQNELLLTINLSSSPESLLCRISNNVNPMPYRSRLQFDKYSGVLFLNSIRAATVTQGKKFPFILDNSSLGLLDQNYNFLDGDFPTAQTAGKLKGGPFILDDSTWGLLDKTYNVLI